MDSAVEEVQQYLQDSLLGIDEDSAVEAAEMLGETPPIFITKDNLLYEMQQALLIYEHLDDRIDQMNGRFLGKSYNNVCDIFSIFEVTELRQEILGFLKVIDYRVTKFYNDKADQKSSLSGATNGREHNKSNNKS